MNVWSKHKACWLANIWFSCSRMLFFVMTYWKKLQLLGALPPDPYQGLCPTGGLLQPPDPHIIFLLFHFSPVPCLTDLKLSSSLSSFKSRLKTHLFKKSYSLCWDNCHRCYWSYHNDKKYIDVLRSWLLILSLLGYIRTEAGWSLRSFLPAILWYAY